MSTVLYIKANARPEGESRTFRISDRFVETYKKHHPDDTIVVLDLYKEDIHFSDSGRSGQTFGRNVNRKEHHRSVYLSVSQYRQVYFCRTDVEPECSFCFKSIHRLYQYSRHYF